MKKDKGLKIVDDDGKERFFFSEERLEVLKAVFEVMDNEIKDLEEAIATQRSTNYLFSRLLHDYPNNNGVCYVNKREVEDEVKAKALEYDDNDLISDILDRLEDELEELKSQYSVILDQLDSYDLLSIFYELEGEVYKVVAMDRNIVKKNGIKWAADKFVEAFGKESMTSDYSELERVIREWVDNG